LRQLGRHRGTAGRADHDGLLEEVDFFGIQHYDEIAPEALDKQGTFVNLHGRGDSDRLEPGHAPR
jgi:hypothetical protein